MPNLYKLRKQIDSARELLSVVRTMKAMAAVNIRQFERAVESVQAYDQNVQRGFQVLLHNRPEMISRAEVGPRRRTGLVVFGSDQGMCGGFNERAARHAGTVELPEDQCHVVVACGHRVVSLLGDYGVPAPDEQLALPASVEAVPGFVRRLQGRIEYWEAERALQRVVVVFNATGADPGYTPRLREMLPLDRQFLERLAEQPWPGRRLPSFGGGADALFSSLVREYLFASLYRACAESLAAENAARLSSMQSAQKNISERLEELQISWRRRRQTAITAELLDIMGGYEAQEGEN